MTKTVNEMNIEKELVNRSGSKCELCGANDNLKVHLVPPKSIENTENCILLCDNCLKQIETKEDIDINHWRCLNDSMWSQIPAIQVMAWRILNRIKAEGWPQDLLDMLYLEEDVLAWAKAMGEADEDSNSVKHLDSNGVLLQAGDTVVLIKDLDVKGAGFTAKRGTAVRNISLVADNPEHIEGRVNGQHIVILTKFTKKSS